MIFKICCSKSYTVEFLLLCVCFATTTSTSQDAPFWKSATDEDFFHVQTTMQNLEDKLNNLTTLRGEDAEHIGELEQKLVILERNVSAHSTMPSEAQIMEIVNNALRKVGVVSEEDLCGGNGWIPTPTSCLKQLSKKMNYASATTACAAESGEELDKNNAPHLLEIRNIAEQDSKLRVVSIMMPLSQYGQSRIWLSAKATRRLPFLRWSNGDPVTWTGANSRPELHSISDDVCTELPIGNSTEGKWNYSGCNKSNRVVCEKSHATSTNFIEKLTKSMDALEERVRNITTTLTMELNNKWKIKWEQKLMRVEQDILEIKEKMRGVGGVGHDLPFFKV